MREEAYFQSQEPIVVDAMCAPFSGFPVLFLLSLAIIVSHFVFESQLQAVFHHEHNLGSILYGRLLVLLAVADSVLGADQNQFAVETSSEVVGRYVIPMFDTCLSRFSLNPYSRGTISFLIIESVSASRLPAFSMKLFFRVGIT